MRGPKAGAALWTVLAFVMVLAGCQRAAMKPMGENPKEPAPAPPGFEGSWAASSSYEDGDRTINESVVVTFTKERYIEAWQSHAEGELQDEWGLRGTWEVSGGTITKTYDEYGYEGVRLMGSVDKAYHWGNEAHDTLFVEEWPAREPRTVFWKLTRMKNAVPTAETVVGTWTYLEPHRPRLWTMKITAAGGFELTIGAPDDEKPNRMTGQVRGIDLENLYVNLAGLTWYDADGSAPRVFLSDVSEKADGTGRIAFAPAHDGKLRVSHMWNEPPNRQLGQEERDWSPQPYGDYGLLFTKSAP